MISVPYKFGDLRAFTPRAVHLGDADAISRSEEIIELGNTVARTLMLRDGTVVGVIAITKLRAHISELWACLSDDIKKHPLAFARECKHVLTSHVEENRIQRLQCYIRTDAFGEGPRWMQFLGFEFEGVLRKFGADGRDYAAWSRV